MHLRKLHCTKNEVFHEVSPLTKYMLYFLLIFQLMLTLFYQIFFWLIITVLHCSAFSFRFWCYLLCLWLICDYIDIELRYVLLYCLFPWWFLENIHILSDKFPIWFIPFHRIFLIVKVGHTQLDWKHILATTN